MIERNAYGELIATPDTQHLIEVARTLIAAAAAKKRIPPAHDRMPWTRVNARTRARIGTALHHEIYDISAGGRHALICCRATEGTRYGIATREKSYYLLSRHGQGVRVASVSKAVAAKAAKSSSDLGQAIAVCAGRAVLEVASAKQRRGYKLVRRAEDGTLVSVWDGSPWVMGKTRIEAATADHSGGHYYYASELEALAAVEGKAAFGPDHAHRDLVLIEVAVSGREYMHGNKRCVTKMTPIRVVREVGNE